MRVLVISRNAWDNTNSIGNTLSNFLQNMTDVQFANIYFRGAKPNNNICKHYYQVTESDVIKKWFHPHKIGKEFFWDEGCPKSDAKFSGKKEKKIIHFIHKHNLKLAYKISDSIWYSKKWLNAKFDNFIESFSPDLVISFAKSAPQYYLTVKHLKEKLGIPVFSWIADDEYTSLVKNKSRREIRNLRYIIKESKILRGCSEEICEYYNSVFGCNASPLYKGCDFSKKTKDFNRDTIQVVYAGNLLYGRLDVICKFAEALEKYNENTRDIKFEIYSSTLMPLEIKTYFDSLKSTKYMGQHDYEVIKQRLFEADIVLHAESFDENEIIKTKYSFSTKIIDCLQSGSVLLAIGPSDIASIKYVKKIPGAFVIDNVDSLEKKIKFLLDECETFSNRASSIRVFAQKHHDSKMNSVDLRETFSKIIKGEH